MSDAGPPLSFTYRFFIILLQAIFLKNGFYASVNCDDDDDEDDDQRRYMQSHVNAKLHALQNKPATRMSSAASAAASSFLPSKTNNKGSVLNFPTMTDLPNNLPTVQSAGQTWCCVDSGSYSRTAQRKCNIYLPLCSVSVPTKL